MLLQISISGRTLNTLLNIPKLLLATLLKAMGTLLLFNQLATIPLQQHPRTLLQLRISKLLSTHTDMPLLWLRALLLRLPPFSLLPLLQFVWASMTAMHHNKMVSMARSESGVRVRYHPARATLRSLNSQEQTTK